jgi:hypothetical protein
MDTYPLNQLFKISNVSTKLLVSQNSYVYNLFLEAGIPKFSFMDERKYHG